MVGIYAQEDNDSSESNGTKSVYYSFSNPTGKNKKALGLSDDSLDGCERFILNPKILKQR
jgi:hypothetical protein